MAKKAKPASPPSGKSTAAKKTAAKPAAKSPAKSAPKSAPAKAGVTKLKTDPPQASVPATTAPSLAERFTSAEAAKEATIDALLEIIEVAEHRLSEVKRVRTFAELEPLANGQL